MSISCIRRNTCSIISLLLVLQFITSSSSSSLLSPTNMVTKELLNELCSQKTTLHNRFCITWLTADPRTMSITIHGFIELIVEKTLTFGLKNLVLMTDLARNSSDDDDDKQLKEAYESCVVSYGITIKELERAKELLRNSSYKLGYYAASKALDYSFSCNDQFDGPSSEPDMVLQRDDRFVRMCHIARDFAGLFN